MSDNDFSSEEQLFSFFKDQLNSWESLKNNYIKLEYVRKKEIFFSDCKMIITFNPSRILSSNAKVDSISIQKRVCFLCQQNRPIEQKGLTILEKYTLLVNPFPIFDIHLTIIDNNHTDQLLTKERLKDMLKLAEILPSFSILYNGPTSGASAPDHFHFQAGLQGYMPVEEEIYKDFSILISSSCFSIKEKANYIRKVLLVEGSEEAILTQIIDKIVYLIKEVLQTEEKPKINIITFYKESKWQICIFPRIAHRPAQFFKEGEEKILFSPGAVDMGGTIILPREEDFEKITPFLIENMFRQITFSDNDWKKLIEEIRNMKL